MADLDVNYSEDADYDKCEDLLWNWRFVAVLLDCGVRRCEGDVGRNLVDWTIRTLLFHRKNDYPEMFLFDFWCILSITFNLKTSLGSKIQFFQPPLAQCCLEGPQSSDVEQVVDWPIGLFNSDHFYISQFSDCIGLKSRKLSNYLNAYQILIRFPSVPALIFLELRPIQRDPIRVSRRCCCNNSSMPLTLETEHLNGNELAFLSQLLRHLETLLTIAFLWISGIT